ncbi:MAG: CBS domain-containing protein [Leptothrix ochracea]|jgi:CBS domain-containing protein|uniref:CBS domain-containing protein n=1 Tax=Leptothrix ochracea TaxID=735331 RepID=UPI0034E27FF6
MNHSTFATFKFPDGTCIAQAQPLLSAVVTLDSPGTEVMTDLTKVKAATIQPGTSLVQAKQMMIYQGVRLLFVVENMPCVEGLITSTDLEGDRPMRAAGRREVLFDELVVSDVMSPLSELDVIDYDDLSHSKVSKVIATLKHLGRHHLLVVQKATPQSAARIRGVVSQTQIERQLGHSIGAAEIASTFSEIRAALGH